MCLLHAQEEGKEEGEVVAWNSERLEISEREREREQRKDAGT